MKTFEQIAEAVVTAKGVEQAIVQQTYTRDSIRIARESGSDAWKHRRPLRNEFRVFVATNANDPKGGKVHCERVGPDLLSVVKEVFAQVGLALPKEL